MPITQPCGHSSSAPASPSPPAWACARLGSSRHRCQSSAAGTSRTSATVAGRLPHRRSPYSIAAAAAAQTSRAGRPSCRSRLGARGGSRREVGGADRRRAAAVAVGVEGDADAAPAALRQQHRRRRGGVAPPAGREPSSVCSAANETTPRRPPQRGRRGAATVRATPRRARAAEQSKRHARRVERLLGPRHAARRCVGQRHDGARKGARELGRRDERAHLRRPRRQLRPERERHRAHRAPCRVRAREARALPPPQAGHPLRDPGTRRRRQAAPTTRSRSGRPRPPQLAAVADRTARSSSAAAASATAPAGIVRSRTTTAGRQPHNRERSRAPRALRASFTVCRCRLTGCCCRVAPVSTSRVPFGLRSPHSLALQVTGGCCGASASSRPCRPSEFRVFTGRRRVCSCEGRAYSARHALASRSPRA